MNDNSINDKAMVYTLNIRSRINESIISGNNKKTIGRA